MCMCMFESVSLGPFNTAFGISDSPGIYNCCMIVLNTIGGCVKRDRVVFPFQTGMFQWYIIKTISGYVNMTLFQISIFNW